MNYSIIIPALNEEKHIKECLMEVKKQAPDAEVILVDGVSTDRTVEIAQQLGAFVVIEKKRSVGAARTKGLKSAHGDVVCFIDADTVPSPSWFEQITEPFTDESVVGVGGMVEPIEGTLLERLGLWFVFGVVSPVFFKMGLPLVTGQNMAFRRKEALAVGGFLEVVKQGKNYTEGEDTIMFLNIKKTGRIVHSKSRVCVSMRRIRNWGLPRYVLFNIRNYVHLLRYGTPIEDEYEAIRK